MAAVIALTLLIGCVNVSCLLAARGATRRNETALRMALGAGAGRILRQSLVESCLLALAGGALGIAVTVLGERLILAGLQWGQRPIDLAPDPRVLGFALALTMAAGILCGLLPALQALRTRQLEIYRDGQLRPFRSGKVLIALEVALSLTLVAAAGMFLRGVANLRSVPLGFNARDVATILLFPDYDKFPEGPNERYLTAEASRLRDRLAALPGMERTASADTRAFQVGTSGYSVTRADTPEDTSDEPVNVHIIHADDRYFDVLQIPLAAGRRFSARDDGGAERVAILSQSLARQLFGNANPLGRRVSVGMITPTVVGIVGDVRTQSVKEPAGPMLYLPFWQPPAGRGWSAQTAIHVRTSRPVGDIKAQVQEELASGRYALQMMDASTLEEVIGASYHEDRIRMQATSLFASLALVLIAAGIYGLMAHAVAQRSREIGVRMAVGATPPRIVGLILRDTMKLVAIGLVLGIPAALAVMRLLSAYVFELSPADPGSLGGAVAVLLATAGLAAASPAWRATRVDPVQSLRAE